MQEPYILLIRYPELSHSEIVYSLLLPVYVHLNILKRFDFANHFIRCQKSILSLLIVLEFFIIVIAALLEQTFGLFSEGRHRLWLVKLRVVETCLLYDNLVMFLVKVSVFEFRLCLRLLYFLLLVFFCFFLQIVEVWLRLLR